jgi:uncharacterized protein with FMN-binding domain
VKRAPIVLAATAAGLAATLGFHARTPTVVTASSPPPAPRPAATATAAASAATKPSSSKTAIADASTRYGDVELRVTVANGKITQIKALQLPSDDPKSSAISSYAEPLLRQSALAKQSADVDFVSGATFTSDGYKTALQAALDRAA